MTTIVSAFISDVNDRPDRNINKYYEFGKLLLKSTTPKIIFLDNEMYNIVQNDKAYNIENTFLINYKKTESYLYNFIDNITSFNVNTTYPLKDTIDYMCLICNKTEFVKKAIEIDPFNSKNYVWIDFGIKHVYNCENENIFIDKLNEINYKNYNNVRIASIWDFNKQYNVNIYKDICWYFSGGVFGGNKEKLLLFAELMKQKCIKIIQQSNTIMWEVNIWYLIYCENPSLFDPYYGNHNKTIVDNY